MPPDPNSDRPLARFARWIANGLGWTSEDVVTRLRRHGADKVRGAYARHLLNGERAVSKNIALAFAKTFAWPHGGREGAREPAYLFVLVHPDGTPHLLRDESGAMGYSTDRDYAWKLCRTLRDGGFTELTAIPVWPSALEGGTFPVEPPSIRLDPGPVRGGDVDSAAQQAARELLRFLYEAIGLSENAQALTKVPV